MTTAIMLRSGNIACGPQSAISMGIGGQYCRADYPPLRLVCLLIESLP